MSLSEETRLELLKTALEVTLNHGPSQEPVTHEQIIGFHNFLLGRMKVSGEEAEHPDCEALRSLDGNVHVGISGNEISSGPSLNIPPELLKLTSQVFHDFSLRLFDSLSLDLRPSADIDATAGADDFIAVLSFRPFSFSFKGSAAFPAGKIHININHNSSPHFSEPHPTDSQSTGRNESVADRDGEDGLTLASAHRMSEAGDIPLFRFIADRYRMSEGIARRSIRAGRVSVDGRMTADENELVPPDADVCVEPLRESPTDAELRERGCPELVETRAVTFLCQLPDAELRLIAALYIPAALRGKLARLAKDELQRRRDA